VRERESESERVRERESESERVREQESEYNKYAWWIVRCSANYTIDNYNQGTRSFILMAKPMAYL
jgi:hypothetical protein